MRDVLSPSHTFCFDGFLFGQANVNNNSTATTATLFLPQRPLIAHTTTTYRRSRYPPIHILYLRPPEGLHTKGA